MGDRLEDVIAEAMRGDHPCLPQDRVLAAVRAYLLPEERPVGEHEWDSGFTCMRCRCVWADAERAKAACPSKRERRWVTPWEPVPQKQSTRSEDR